MTNRIHPQEALVDTGKTPPIISPCEHYAGSEKLIQKALQLQIERNGDFDITADCEDGAQKGEEKLHAQMIARCLATIQPAGRVGVRIHDPQNPAWKSEAEILLGEVADRLAYVTIPKVSAFEELLPVVEYLNSQAGTLAIKVLFRFTY